MAAVGKGRKQCFINMTLTVQDIDTPRQQFTLTGYINAIWRCPDLEKEEERSDYYSADNNGPTVKDALVGADSNRGYVRDSNTQTSGVLKYVTGFDLSVESDVLPFSPKRMFDTKRIRGFSLSSCDYYYYPIHHNRGKTCAGLLKMACNFEVTLVQKFNMHYFPFDRQLLHLNIFVRHWTWDVQYATPDWVDTGYENDRLACNIFLSEAILSYTLLDPWIDNRPGSFQGKGSKTGYHVYIKVERRFEYELRKVVQPLFFIVLFAMSSFGLEPDETNDRVAAPTGMMLAVIGFQYVIQETVPKQPQLTRLDTYIVWCMTIIIMIVAQSLGQKQLLESTIARQNITDYGEMEIADVDRNGIWYHRAEWIDSICALLCFVAWVLPHAIIYWYMNDLESLPFSLGQKILMSWEDSLHFIESYQEGESRGELMERGALGLQHALSLKRWQKSARNRAAESGVRAIPSEQVSSANPLAHPNESSFSMNPAQMGRLAMDAQPTSVEDATTDVAELLSQLNKLTEDPLLVRRVTEALGTTWPDPGAWVRELQAMHNDGELDDFLSLCRQQKGATFFSIEGDV